MLQPSDLIPIMPRLINELHPTISICFISVSQARKTYCSKSKHLHFFGTPTYESSVRDEAVRLDRAYRFVVQLCKSVQQNPNGKFFACVDAKEVNMFSTDVIFIGAYMILGLKMTPDQVEDAFRSLIEHFFSKTAGLKDHGTMVLDSWRALCRVRDLGWIDVSVTDLSIINANSNTIDIDEWTHYSNPANGSLYIIAPGRLLLIPSPKDFPDGRDWMDDKGTRRFSSEFYADLLGSEFGVVLVLSLAYDDEVVEYDSAAFDRRGIAVENVPLGPRGAAQHHLLFAADRVLANLRAAPGAVAVHMHGGGTGCGDRLGLLLATGLVSVFGFTAGEAAAWLQMACPPLRAPAAQLCAEFGPLAAVGRTASAPACWTLGEPAGPSEWKWACQNHPQQIGRALSL
jgi:hypothetical protein